ncbi:hypothetical protein GL263_15520 [Streptomyces durbertensis]|uniref:Uncharacterized protein n=1 Tax=Streptomyces durbertensis TaxID=2448886 RepID=A0ABR6EJ34_9ACTN|nr:hypothetical protein [Streptomyces durbertensis]
MANVAGQAAVPVIVSAREKILDRDAYDNATSFDINDLSEERTADAPPAPAGAAAPPTPATS